MKIDCDALCLQLGNIIHLYVGQFYFGIRMYLGTLGTFCDSAYDNTCFSHLKSVTQCRSLIGEECRGCVQCTGALRQKSFFQVPLRMQVLDFIK